MRFTVEFDPESSTWSVMQFDCNNLPVCEFFGLSLDELLAVLNGLSNEFLEV